jgi:3-phenylpropionate/trans-cinnamate dioxygenase ferredoxin component
MQEDDCRFTPMFPVEELRPGQPRRCQVEGKDLLFCRLGDGSVYAVENLCSHMRKPLHGGRLIGPQITCPEHGAVFDVRSGEALSFPAVRPINTYPVEIRDGMVFIAITDAQDEQPIKIK